MKRGRWADHPELLAERSRMGVVRAATLISLGMDSRSVYRRCLPGGPWRWMLPGIVVMQNSPPTAEQRVIAALVYAGPKAVITGLEACRRHGLRTSELPDDDRVHVLVPHHHKIRSSEFVIVERTRRLPRPVVRDEVPLAPLGRAVLDASRRIRETVAKILIEAMQRGRCSPMEMASELDEGCQRGSAIPRRLLAEVRSLRSIAELYGKRLSDRLAVLPTHWNVPIFGPDGSYVGCPDAWWDDVALAWEIDSYEWHFYRDGYARTLQRNSRYAAAGITVVQTLPSEILTDPEGVVAKLDAAYRAAAARTRPPVRTAREAA